MTEKAPSTIPKHHRSAWHYGLAIHNHCSRCGAEPGSICRTPSGAKKSSLHEERWALIAGAPTIEQLAGPYPGIEQHDEWWARLRAAQDRWESSR